MKNFNRLGLVLCISVLIVSTIIAAEKPNSEYKGPKAKLHIYLLIGQSNMAGRAKFSKEEEGAISGCFLLNSENRWEPAKNPLNRYSTIRKGLNMQKMNPGYYFARTMLAKKKDLSLGLVVNAKGGTKIEQWVKGTKFYKDAIKRTKEAQKTGTLKGILWHQGESNQKNPDGYLEKMKALITDLRKDLGVKDLPFVAGQVKDVPKINEQIAELPEAVKNTSYVSSEGLTTQDRWHFDSKSMKIMGERYAEEMLKLQK